MELNPDQWQAILRLGIFFAEAVLTAVLVAWLRFRQKGQAESWGFMIRLLFLGSAVALVSGIIEMRYSIRITDLKDDLAKNYYPWYALVNFASSATIEELAKYAAAILVISRHPRLNKASDIILYFILIGLGFSLIEDVLYFIDPQTIAPYRLFSFFMHAGTAALMGGGLVRYMVGQAGYGAVVKSILGVIALHFIYNYSSQLTRPLAAWMLCGLIVAYLTVQIVILFKWALPLDKAKTA